jgi:hypothetical protein
LPIAVLVSSIDGVFIASPEMRICFVAFLAVPILVDSFQVLRQLRSERKRHRRSKASLSLSTDSVAYLEGLSQSSSSSPSIPGTCTATTTTTTHSWHNPRYPSYSFEKYLENPFFHRINTSYPGLQLIHQEPYIFIINNFLTPQECARLRAKADADDGMLLRPQIGGGSVSRTSTGVVCTREEVPTIQQKMMHLTAIHNVQQLQYLKVSKYEPGQTFSKHTDAWPTEGAPISRGWINAADFFGDERRRTVGCIPALEQPNHNTLLTCFVYLNTIHDENGGGGGGCTVFPNIGIHTGQNNVNFYTQPSPMDSRRRQDGSAWDWEYRANKSELPVRVGPQEGMAVLHLCSLLPEHGGVTDGNVLHVAEPPALGNVKYIAQQFIASCTAWTLPEDSMPIGRVTWDTI